MSSQRVCNNIHPTAQLGSTPIGSEDPARALLGHTGNLGPMILKEKSVYPNSTSLKLPMAHQVNCWKHKQQNRRVKRSLVRHDKSVKSVHSWVQERSLGLEPRLAWDSPTFKGKNAWLLFVHRTRFTQTVFYGPPLSPTSQVNYQSSTKIISKICRSLTPQQKIDGNHP